MKTTLNTSGLDKLQDKLKSLEKEQQVPVTDLMPPAFMQKHTQCSNIQEFLDASGIEDNDEINSEEFSRYVAENTQFDSWQDMLQAAGTEYMKKQLGF